jgi:hypothetical protein
MTTFTPDLTAAWYNIELMDTENCMHIVASTTALLLHHFTATTALLLHHFTATHLSMSNKNQYDFL